MDNDNSSSSLLLLFAPTLSLLRIIVAAVGKSVPLSLVLLDIRRGARPNLARNICVFAIDNSIIFSLLLLLLVDVMINVGGGRVVVEVSVALEICVFLGGNLSVLPLSFLRGRNHLDKLFGLEVALTTCRSKNELSI